MKKIILIMAILFSFAMADSVLLVKKGWQLIGSSVTLEDMSKFKADSVEQVWHFDAKTQIWLGHSPDASTQKKMDDKNISRLESLENWHGFWVKSKADWSLIFEDKVLNTKASKKEDADVIALKKGWNLISLPMDVVLSANIFKGMTVWKYSDKSWELFTDKVEQENFPKLGHIKNSDGIWVKADKDTNISLMLEASKLHNFASKEDMQHYIKERASINTRPFCGTEPFVFNQDLGVVQPTSVPEFIQADDGAGTVKNTSDTNLQENDVDESDILKHNGKHIFYVGKKDFIRGHINITSFDELVKDKSKVLNTIILKDKNIDSFYLAKNRLVVLSSSYFDHQAYEDPFLDDKANSMFRVQTIVDIFDVSDIKNIQKIAEYKIDGSLNNSRVIGDNLYLISGFSPELNIRYPKEYLTPSKECKAFVNGTVKYKNIKNDYSKYADCYTIIKEDTRYYKYNYDKPNIEVVKLLPQLESASAKQDLVMPQRLYASSKQNQSINMTSISQFSISKATYLNNTSIMGYNNVTYASINSLYLVSDGYPVYYDFYNYRQRSMLYKFNFDEEVSYSAVGSVYGRALNQFALSEYKDILRIATTEGFSWAESGTKNSLYTLKEKEGLLLTEGVLTGLGKKGETIKSVRYMGNKAYLVTFRTTDPLYTIDLSDPQKPKKMGELEINGYSAYLHPIGENRLLGVGQDADSEGRNTGVKIELFDISDFENPSSLDSIVLKQGTVSELEHKHKALAYRSSDSLFAFPYSHYGYTSNSYQINNYLGIYQVEENTLKSYEPLQSMSENWGEHRGLIFDVNETSYVSFFSDDEVITKKLTTKEK